MDRYNYLAEKYGWTYDEIADMSPLRQLAACGVVNNTVTFKTEAELMAWRASRGK